MSKNALISIIIPTYNRASLLLYTLESVKKQTYINWECIIIDDNSSDDTFNIVTKFIKDDERFKLVIKSNGVISGASSSRNLGLSLAQGEFIQFLDSDDILAPNKIDEQLQLLTNNEKDSVVVCKWELFNEEIAEVENFNERAEYSTFENSKDYFELIGKFGGFYPPECFLLPRKLIDFSGHWNESITLNDDGEFFFRILYNSKKIIFCDSTHVYHRKSKPDGDNLSLLNSRLKAKHLINSWKIIEALYSAKFDDENSSYISKKKHAVYYEIKRTYPTLIAKNKFFFKKQIKADTIIKRFTKLYRRVLKKLKTICE